MISLPNCRYPTKDRNNSCLISRQKCAEKSKTFPRRFATTSGQCFACHQGCSRRVETHQPPLVICTIARGSSDHAASFLKYAIELTARVPVASLGPSINSIYGVDLKLNSGACIAISQSGKSPDITAMAQSARTGGACTIAITNESQSPLANVCNHTINIQAGKEESVAATKTFLTSIVSGLLLLGHWQHDQRLLDGLQRLPEQAKKAIECDWSELTRRLLREDALYVLGRGPSFAIANEGRTEIQGNLPDSGGSFQLSRSPAWPGIDRCRPLPGVGTGRAGPVGTIDLRCGRRSGFTRWRRICDIVKRQASDAPAPCGNRSPAHRPADACHLLLRLYRATGTAAGV